MDERLKWYIKPLYFKMQHLLMLFSDEQFLKIKYLFRVGKRLNLDNPTTYNEKMQWMKLHNRKNDYTKYTDKITVKELVKEMIGEEYIIPTIGVWERFDDIDFDKLPDRFVLKCTHDSGSVVICDDRKQFDIRQARRKLNAEMKRNFYWGGREIQYRDIKPRIIAEPYIGEKGDIRDYKFYMFNGAAKAVLISTDRNKKSGLKTDFFDMDFNHLDFTHGHPNADVPPQKPVKFDEMVRLAEILSKGMPHVRIDFYEYGDRVLFGEYTFYSGDGMIQFKPEKWDRIFGEWIDIRSIE